MPSTVLTSEVSAGAHGAVSEHCIWQQVTLGLMGDHWWATSNQHSLLDS